MDEPSLEMALIGGDWHGDCRHQDQRACLLWIVVHKLQQCHISLDGQDLHDPQDLFWLFAYPVNLVNLV